MAKTALSKTQIDRLGERLKKGPLTEEDIRLLDEYRLSFGEAYEAVVQPVRQCGQSPTGRIKTRNSIVLKLRRESIRLTQIQDIVGCRIVVSDTIEQDRIVGQLANLLAKKSIVDRRADPSHGYRAVHLIALEFDKPVEVQVRTELQHLWAEWSEKLSDLVGPEVKYGGGPPEIKELLERASFMVGSVDNDWLKADRETDGLLSVAMKAEARKYELKVSGILRHGIDLLSNLSRGAK